MNDLEQLKKIKNRKKFIENKVEESKQMEIGGILIPLLVKSTFQKEYDETIERIEDLETNIYNPDLTEIKNIWAKDDNRFFQTPIKPFDYDELNGKILKITICKNKEYRMISGIDTTENKIYVLSYEKIKEGD